MRGRWKQEAPDWGRTLAYSAVLFFALRVAVVEAYHVPTGSMRPTIHEGDRILATKFHYWLWAPQAGDVVVLRTPDKAQGYGGPPSRRLVKRVVAVEGDHVAVADGVLWINGRPVEEPYIQDAPEYRLPPAVVPPEHVLVLGDNRNNSLDGHVWGFLDEDALLGRAWVRYWPPNRIGAL